MGGRERPSRPTTCPRRVTIANVRFAVFTVSLPDWTPEEAVGHLAALGYDGVEWRVTDQPASETPGFWAGNRCTWPFATFVDDAPRIRALTEAAGLAMPNVGTYVACTDADSVERAMAGAARAGAPAIRVQVARYDGRSPYLPQRDRALAAFEGVARMAERHGVRALVELHFETLLPSASAAASFLGRFDPQHAGVIHDAGNMVFEGFESYRMGLEVLGPYVAHVHLKNAWWKRTPSGWHAEFAPLRDGVVDVTALLTALAAVGYDGWVSFEDFSTAQPLLERTGDNLAYVKELLARQPRVAPSPTA